jgi:toxin FitB
VNVVDSSGWLEYFAGGPNAPFFARPIESTQDLIVPVISIYEVFKKVMLEGDRYKAAEITAQMLEGRVIDLNFKLAMDSAALSLEHKLPMADSIILAIAQAYGATLWTQDVDFEKIKGVKFVGRKSRS